MSYLEPGNIYKINRMFWLLYPTKETAVAAPATAAPPCALAALAASWASYWSERLNCTVSFISEGDTIMIVEVSGIQVKVINQEGVSGWINFPETEEWVKGKIVEVYSGH